MIDERSFPVLLSCASRRERAEREQHPCPTSVPWEMVEPHETQARRNHWQSLDALAGRGGLAPCELIAVLEDRPWRRMPYAEAVARVLELLAEWEARP